MVAWLVVGSKPCIIAPASNRALLKRSHLPIRIGIDYRFLSKGRNAVNRGVGRYTQQQIREVLRQDAENQYILFCFQEADLSLLLPEIRAAHNVSIARLPPVGDASSPHALHFTARYQQAIYDQRVDVHHLTIPALTSEKIIGFDVCRLVATHYDLIPIVYPDAYLPSAEHRREYSRALTLLKRSHRLIAISNYVRDEAMHYLGIPIDRIDTAYPIPDPSFRVLSAEQLKPRLAKLRHRFSIPEHFIMAVTYPHYTKNLETLITAYGRLPPTLRRQLPLVLTFNTEGVLDYIRQLARDAHVLDDIVITGFVKDEELVTLLNAAMMLVHPSRYEGFGLPVIEAMVCGTPVITTTGASLPEAGGDAAVFVDPEDAAGFADAIEALFGDPERRTAMRERGFEHVKKFNPTQLGQVTLQTYLNAMLTEINSTRTNIIQLTEESARRPRIALWTPLPPLKSGIADHIVPVLAELSKDFEIELFVDDAYIPHGLLTDQYYMHHYSAYKRRHAQKPFDVNIYELGSSFYHLYMYSAILERPGIVVIHDLVWGFVLYHSAMQKGDLKQFSDSIPQLESEEARRTFEHLSGLPDEERRQALDAFFIDYFMLKPVIERSLLQLVHMPLAKTAIDARYEKANVQVMQLGTDDPWHTFRTLNPRLVRDTLRMAPSAFVIGVFGNIDPVKRIDVCLGAFRQLLDTWPDSLLLIVGEGLDPVQFERLQQLAIRLGVSHRVVFTGRVAASDFDRYLIACDVVVNLRFPARMQMSSTLTRALAAGKPVIVSDIPEWAFLPENACWRVRPDAQEITNLYGYLAQLATDPNLLRERSESARAYYEDELTVSQLVQHYKQAIDQVISERTQTKVG